MNSARFVIAFLVLALAGIGILQVSWVDEYLVTPFTELLVRICAVLISIFGGSVSKLYGLEGLVAQGYFFAWRALEIQWASTKRLPVPDEWKTFFSRSSLKWGDRYIQNQHATHPINAMLNYAYALLESEVRIKAIAGMIRALGSCMIASAWIGIHSYSIRWNRCGRLRIVGSWS